MTQKYETLENIHDDENQIDKSSSTHEEDAEIIDVELGTEAHKAKLLHDITKARAITDRVRLFSKIMDTYGVDALLGLVPILGDGAMSTIATLYLLYEGRKLGLSTVQSAKIVSFQLADAIVGSIPFPGLSEIADYFFKANRAALVLFEEKLLEIEQAARDAGATQAEIDALDHDKQRIMDILRSIKAGISDATRRTAS